MYDRLMLVMAFQSSSGYNSGYFSLLVNSLALRLLTVWLRCALVILLTTLAIHDLTPAENGKNNC